MLLFCGQEEVLDAMVLLLSCGHVIGRSLRAEREHARYRHGGVGHEPGNLGVEHRSRVRAEPACIHSRNPQRRRVEQPGFTVCRGWWGHLSVLPMKCGGSEPAVSGAAGFLNYLRS